MMVCIREGELPHECRNVSCGARLVYVLYSLSLCLAGQTRPDVTWATKNVLVSSSIARPPFLRGWLADLTQQLIAGNADIVIDDQRQSGTHACTHTCYSETGQGLLALCLAGCVG